LLTAAEQPILLSQRQRLDIGLQHCLVQPQDIFLPAAAKQGLQKLRIVPESLIERIPGQAMFSSRFECTTAMEMQQCRVGRCHQSLFGDGACMCCIARLQRAYGEKIQRCFVRGLKRKQTAAMLFGFGRITTAQSFAY